MIAAVIARLEMLLYQMIAIFFIALLAIITIFTFQNNKTTTGLR